MKIILTNDDVRNIVDTIFNEKDEKIILIDGEEREVYISEYLNIHFYSWKNRLAEKENPFDAWVDSLNYSIDESYALVELVDCETTPSVDIDNATLSGRISFLVQADKVKNLDYYVFKLRNKYLGNPQDIKSAEGETLKAYINLGILLYDDEPAQTALGECVIATLNFSISYLTEALTYNVTPVSLSLDGQNFMLLPYTKGTFQNIFTSTNVPRQLRPDLTGFVASAASNIVTFSYYDFNKELTNVLNDLFWKISAISIDGVDTTVGVLNIPIWIKVQSNGHEYLYKYMIDSMEKTISNSDFVISSITLKGYGK